MPVLSPIKATRGIIVVDAINCQPMFPQMPTTFRPSFNECHLTPQLPLRRQLSWGERTEEYRAKAQGWKERRGRCRLFAIRNEFFPPSPLFLFPSFLNNGPVGKEERRKGRCFASGARSAARRSYPRDAEIPRTVPSTKERRVAEAPESNLLPSHAIIIRRRVAIVGRHNEKKKKKLSARRARDDRGAGQQLVRTRESNDRSRKMCSSISCIPRVSLYRGILTCQFKKKGSVALCILSVRRFGFDERDIR